MGAGMDQAPDLQIPALTVVLDRIDKRMVFIIRSLTHLRSLTQINGCGSDVGIIQVCIC